MSEIGEIEHGWARSMAAGDIDNGWTSRTMGEIGSGNFRGWERLREIGERNKGKRDWEPVRENRGEKEEKRIKWRERREKRE